MRWYLGTLTVKFLLLSMKKIVAFVLAYNCANMLERAYSKIPKDLVSEIIISDDGSKDATATVAAGLKALYFVNDTNLGYGGNLKASLKRCFDLGADYAVEIHGDGAQFDPSALRLALPYIADGYDLILGSRFIVPGLALKNGMPLIRFLANKGLSFFDRWILGLKLTEFHTGFRIYSRSLYERLPWEENSNDYLFSFEIIAQAAYFKLKVAEIPVEADYINEHTSHRLSGAAVYAFQTFYVLFKFIVAKFKLINSSQFPRLHK
jgi:glycosyltransferase involved in cell wall biosynthesis